MFFPSSTVVKLPIPDRSSVVRLLHSLSSEYRCSRYSQLESVICVALPVSLMVVIFVLSTPTRARAASTAVFISLLVIFVPPLPLLSKETVRVSD